MRYAGCNHHHHTSSSSSPHEHVVDMLAERIFPSLIHSGHTARYHGMVIIPVNAYHHYCSYSYYGLDHGYADDLMI